MIVKFRRAVALAAASASLAVAGLIVMPSEAHAVKTHPELRCTIVARSWPATGSGDLHIQTPLNGACSFSILPRWVAGFGYDRHPANVRRVRVTG